MSMMITGIGTALPPHRISQADAAEIAKQFACETAAQERLFQTLYRKAGVDGRNSVVLDTSDGTLESRQTFYGTSAPTTLERMRKYEAEAGSLAVAATETALHEARIAPGRVTHLITVSCSGFYAPGFDISLVKRLPLQAGVARTHIGFMGCQGALNGLRLARAFVDASPSACVLLCALELCSLHHQYGWDADKIVGRTGALRRRCRRCRGCWRRVDQVASLSSHRLGLDRDRRFGRRDDMADRRSRVRDDSLSQSARPDL